jgi:hypothetical protein
LTFISKKLKLKIIFQLYFPPGASQSPWSKSIPRLQPHRELWFQSKTTSVGTTLVWSTGIEAVVATPEKGVFTSRNRAFIMPSAVRSPSLAAKSLANATTKLPPDVCTDSFKEAS